MQFGATRSLTVEVRPPRAATDQHSFGAAAQGRGASTSSGYLPTLVWRCCASITDADRTEGVQPFEAHGESAPTGRPNSNRFVSIITVKDGEVRTGATTSTRSRCSIPQAGPTHRPEPRQNSLPDVSLRSDAESKLNRLRRRSIPDSRRSSPASGAAGRGGDAGGAPPAVVGPARANGTEVGGGAHDRRRGCLRPRYACPRRLSCQPARPRQPVHFDGSWLRTLGHRDGDWDGERVTLSVEAGAESVAAGGDGQDV